MKSTCSTQAGAVSRINLTFRIMSHEKVRSIRITETEVIINSAVNNIRPLFYETWKAERLTGILQTQGRKAVEMELLFNYFTGDFQGRSKYANAVAAAKANGDIADCHEEYVKCCDDPVYRAQFLQKLHSYLSHRIAATTPTETKPIRVTQQQLF